MTLQDKAKRVGTIRWAEQGEKPVNYNVQGFEIGKTWATFHVKKHINCRVCHEFDLKVKIKGEDFNWDTLKKA